MYFIDNEISPFGTNDSDLIRVDNERYAVTYVTSDEFRGERSRSPLA